MRRELESAHCVEHFDVVVAGATSPSGAPAVILGMLPPEGNGWTFPLPIAEARRIAARLIEVADAKERAAAHEQAGT